MDRLEAMSIVLAVAEAGSLSAAARRQKAPLATVSRKVSELEAHLQSKLFNRTSRALVLTDAGRSFVVAAKRILADVAEAAQRFGIPAAWIRVVMRAESLGEVRAVSAKGAMGLMQIMPETWASLRVRYVLGADPYVIRMTTFWPALPTCASCTTAMARLDFWPPTMPVQRATRII